MSHVYYDYFKSPIGWIEIGGSEAAINCISFVEKPRKHYETHSIITRAIPQIRQYFAKQRREFDLPLQLQGTAFQRQTWQQLLTVPYGQTASYKEIAAAIDRPRAVRAVGAANGKNPISIVVPCHRIIGSSGALVGYGSGLWRKEWLLKHEGSRLL